MQLIQDSITLTISVQQDTGWNTPMSNTIHRVLGTTRVFIQYNKWEPVIRQLVGMVTSAADANDLETLYRSQAAITFIGDQAGDSSTVIIESLKFERIFDTLNFARKRFVLSLRQPTTSPS